MTGSYEQFKRDIEELTTINLDFYKEKQMKRRINTLIERYGFDTYDDYFLMLRSDSAKLEYFLNYITINVTDFFRTPDHWSYMENTILPSLIEKFGYNLKIWSAGCSSGEEPFSLAMSLSKYVPISDIEIIATDIDKQALANARRGIYSESALEGVPEEFISEYFIRTDMGYMVNEELRKCVTFSELNLLKDEYPSGCHMIVCRNVLIYFTDEAKSMLFDNFYNSLKIGGCLFLGNAEQIIYYKQQGLMKNNSCIYTKL